MNQVEIGKHAHHSSSHTCLSPLCGKLAGVTARIFESLLYRPLLCEAEGRLACQLIHGN